MNTGIKYKIITVWIASMALFNGLSAQEMLTGLGENSLLQKLYQMSGTRSKSSVEAIKLPFVDDFSNYTGYPDPKLWKDRMGFVNNNYPVNAPSIGVVTLDAIGADGKIYPHASSSIFPADTLTSQPIRLDTNFLLNREMRLSDSLYFSFYYQPGGGSFSNPPVNWERIGNAPETNDKLVLEFGYETGDTIFLGYTYCLYLLDSSYVMGDSLVNPFLPDLIYIFEANMFPNESIMLPCDSIRGPETTWNEMWSSNGQSLDSWIQDNSLEYFKHVMIPILDARYLRNNFQFRFRNYASLEDGGMNSWASNVDQWHIDYVILNQNRTFNDIYPNDVAFVEPSISLLTTYRAVPWSHFSNGDLIDTLRNKLSNLSGSVQNTNYTYRVLKNGTSVYNYNSNSENARPYYPNGFHTYPLHAKPAAEFTIPTDMQDSALITVMHIFQVTGGMGDERHSNDTCILRTELYNYFAYDDGTAESGYTIKTNSPNPQLYLACGFNLKHPDTLRSVRIWFNPVHNEESAQFTLMAWNDDNGNPGEVLAERASQTVRHSEHFTDFSNYYFEEPVAVSGRFYVGFKQTQSLLLNVGFDQNSDARDNFWYKKDNLWEESFFKGSPMIRAVVGKAFANDDAIKENMPIASLIAYPNPTTGTVNLHNLPSSVAIPTVAAVYDMYGKKVAEQQIEGSKSAIQLENCAPGIYIIRLLQQSQVVGQVKVVKIN
ncbi:MAG: T9SS type A sorting domain-containing protein [Bacteroidales bacterium]|jgi:hypothetical protein|nr:T9SS type A sorting domain-containing protein [Bacteroidales bacterium]